MNPNEPRIEIFAPFGEAYEQMVTILFRPFDLKKWLVIGFAAWLATFFSGGSPNVRRAFDKQDWTWKSQHNGPPFSLHDTAPWVIPVIIIIVLLAIALIVLVVWLNARGRFMFTDCIVRNRAAIKEPWREYRTEGNRYFVFQLVMTLINMIVFGGVIALLILSWYWQRQWMPIALLVFFGVIYCLVAIVLAMILKFMVPVMYRQRCDAVSAFRQVWDLLVARPGIFVLFGLFFLVLVVAAGLIGCIATCITCCLTALPYVGTVVLLPVVLFLFAYPLCFLRQFGDPYDVFAMVRPTETPALPIPPVQEEPPPTP